MKETSIKSEQLSSTLRVLSKFIILLSSLNFNELAGKNLYDFSKKQIPQEIEMEKFARYANKIWKLI